MGLRPEQRAAIGPASWIYTDGTVGNGYDRSFDDTVPEGLLEEQRRDNRATVRLSHQSGSEALWSVWLDWSDFNEVRNERLWQPGSLMLAGVISAPDVEYVKLADPSPQLPESFADKLILGWRHRFSPQAQLLVSVSQKLSGDGFGGGNVQFQMFF